MSLPNQLRYSRHNGFRRHPPYYSPFGYGGAGYGGFGNKGQYGGYRSHPNPYPYPPVTLEYPASDRPDRRFGAQRRYKEKDEWVPTKPYHDNTTFVFGIVLLIIIALGIFFGRRYKNVNPFI